MHPAIIAAALLGGGYLLLKKSDPFKGQAQGQMPGVVSSLDKGRNYALIMVVGDLGTKEPGQGASVISGTLGATCGKVLSPAQPKDSGELAKFKAGQPSTWTVNLQWGRDEKSFPSIPWLLNGQAILMPSG
jgi:hypothetical protein